MSRPRFHLAFPVRSLAATRAFYVDLLGARVGRSADRWIDFDFFGHQLSAHLADDMAAVPTNVVDDEAVPASHFGVIVPWADWEALRDRLLDQDVEFLIRPQIRFEGQAGEQATLFIVDPSGNALEFKAFRDDGEIFRRNP